MATGLETSGICSRQCKYQVNNITEGTVLSDHIVSTQTKMDVTQEEWDRIFDKKEDLTENE